MDLKRLQNEVNARWGSQDANLCHKSDTNHALVHMTKALGKVASALNDAEHDQRPPRSEEVGKALADLVICAARFAHGASTDLDAACVMRLDEKFPALQKYGVYDLTRGQWWPRLFLSHEEAQAHYDRCQDVGTECEVRPYPGPASEYAPYA
jgi:hypothetical protein